MSPRIFRYVVKYDAGTAPRPFGGICSLAICKPRIRAKAAVGDWIIGFRSRHPGQVVYAMQVTERLTLPEYWGDGRFENRKPTGSSVPDNIYRPDSNGVIVQEQNPIHGLGDALKDLSGLNVLLSKRFWYFGRHSVPIPNQLVHLVHATQGHAVDKHRRPGDIDALEGWLGTWATGIHGDPIDDRRTASRSGEVDAELRLPPLGSQPPARSAKRSRGCVPSTRGSTFLHSKDDLAFSAPFTQAPPPERLVLSRKGFDSGYGGMPSPILPDGRLVPLSIPSDHDELQMRHSGASIAELADLLKDLSGGRFGLSSTVHLDPDLNRHPDMRLPGWRPSLGQSGTAQSHLAAQHVGVGDVFLFFGWFREVERHREKWRYVPSAPNLHMLFGWLEVGDVLPIVKSREQSLEQHPWIANHPHVSNPDHYSDVRNTLFIAESVSKLRPNSMGGGIFDHAQPIRRLTAPGRSRSAWLLPPWFYPVDRTPLSYHGSLERWTRHSDGCVLNSVAKGQEFVLELAQYPEANAWLKEIVGGC